MKWSYLKSGICQTTWTRTKRYGSSSLKYCVGDTCVQWQIPERTITCILVYGTYFHSQPFAIHSHQRHSVRMEIHYAYKMPAWCRCLFVIPSLIGSQFFLHNDHWSPVLYNRLLVKCGEILKFVVFCVFRNKTIIFNIVSIFCLLRIFFF